MSTPTSGPGAVAFPVLATTCRTLGLTVEQTAAVLEAAAADLAAVERIGDARLDAAWQEGWEAAFERGVADRRAEYERAYAVNVQQIEERSASIDRHNAWIVQIQEDNDNLDRRVRAIESEEARLRAEREDLARRRRQIEDPNARQCDLCERPMPQGRRSDSRFCSPRCRTAACRARAAS